MQNIPTKTYPLSILGDMDELLDEDAQSETQSRLSELQGMSPQDLAVVCPERRNFTKIYAKMARACRAGADDAALGRIFRAEAGFAAENQAKP